MNKQEFYEDMQKIQIAYSKEFNKDELRLWFKEFMTVDKAEFEKAIDKTIKEIKFTPKIADVRARIINLRRTRANIFGFNESTKKE